MVCRDHQHVPLFQVCKDLRQRAVEHGERFGIAVYIVAVTVQHIEIDEIHEAQAAEGTACELQQAGNPLLVAGGENMGGVAAPGEDIVDFADGQHIEARALHDVEHRVGGRRKRKIVAAHGAGERPFALKTDVQSHGRHHTGPAEYRGRHGNMHRVFGRHDRLVRARSETRCLPRCTR